MRFRSAFVLLLAFTLTAVQAQSAADLGAGSASARKASEFPLKPSTTDAQAAQLSASLLTRFHYDARPLDEAMSAKIYKAYFEQIDPEKVFFTQADMNKFAPMKTQFGNAIWNQDLSGPFSVYNLYEQRAIERISYARSLLKQGFDFSGNENYVIDRKKADWAADAAALDQLWRQRTMNDWLRLKLAGKGDDEIRKTLDKRYAGYIERLKQVDSQDVFQAFMTAYAETTDPHTDYLGSRAADQFDIAMKLSLEGIGATLQSRDDYTVIVSLVPGGPAAKSGKLKPGDRILAVGQGESGPLTDVVGWRIDDVTNLIRGKKDTTVRLEMLPATAGQDGKHEILTLVRKKVSLEDAVAKKKVVEIKDGALVHKVGVIELPSFYADFGARRDGDKDYRSATRDVSRLLGELKAEGVEAVVMDLRDNGGGSLDEADSMTGLFTGHGPVVQVRSANGKIEVQGSQSGDPDIQWSGPLAVLVNRGSASASEIFAAAIQDWGRGLIIGQPTFGKGTVQNLIDLDRLSQGTGEKPKLGELKMTIAEFFRINGGSTQLKGVTPDIAFPQNGDEKYFGESTYDNALPWTQIAPAKYQPLANPKAYLMQLQTMHDARIATSPSWKLMLDELAQYKMMRDKTAISLNLATRETERKQQDALQASFRARQKAIDGNDAALADEDSNLDDGLNANERSLSTELQEEKDAKKAADPQLQEAAHIMADAVGLIKTDPKLASQVVPFGGHPPAGTGPTTAAAMAPANPPPPAASNR
jgi:carboxyl-terminal processing protease